MALAVAEAHRILRPGGQLLDIHPQGAPLRLELWRARGSRLPENSAPEAYEQQPLGDLAPEEMVEDFLASSRAIASAMDFQRTASLDFDYRFFFDSLDELTDYLEDNEELDLAGDSLLERALHALQSSPTPAQLVLVQPVIVTCLKKT
jgi:hypothetical protein